MRFVLCPGCGLSMGMPEGYVNFGAWLSAHEKSCPGKKKPRTVARLRRKKEGQEPTEYETEELLREFGEAVAKGAVKRALDAFFKG